MSKREASGKILIQLELSHPDSADTPPPPRWKLNSSSGCALSSQCRHVKTVFTTLTTILLLNCHSVELQQSLDSSSLMAKATKPCRS
ncbi:hypothetical protein F2P81_008416 [Scophthalmus maximus]|uniref:Uncharacterized protein n=1 Tax=Scophthalmus maximus TaxID=52904 RepID=A0A6A4TB89_SCOMX|nr:hypothetical protein F2P81_008416 [Scophthalmus maximus]